MRLKLALSGGFAVLHCRLVSGDIVTWDMQKLMHPLHLLPTHCARLYAGCFTLHWRSDNVSSHNARLDPHWSFLSLCCHLSPRVWFSEFYQSMVGVLGH